MNSYALRNRNENNSKSAFSFSDYTEFNKMFNLYYARLCAYVFEITKNANVSEDIVQEVFLKLWNDRKKLVITENVFAYLLAASRNTAFNHIRGEATRKRNLTDLPHDVGSNEKDLLEEQEFIDFVRQCIEELPERSKQVFLMSRFDGFKQKEISEKLGTSIKTIKNQIWKSLQSLKSCLESKEAL